MSRVGLAAAVIAIATLFPVAGTVEVAASGGEEPPPPVVTVNEFVPEDRDLSDCLSAVPKPDCGSKARGGWRQGLVLGAILAGLGVIAWRIVVASRRTRVAGALDPGAVVADDVSRDVPADRRRTPPSR